MNKEEKYISRVLFKLKVHESNGQAYEDLFIKVMQSSNENFRPIKPQGKIGDRKNDGFDKVNGVYYQVYAPEDIRKSESNALAKIKEDFKGLYNYWNDISKINQFFFVINDKYRGTFPKIEKELSNIENDYNGLVECNPFLVKDLEDTFIKLSEEDIESILGIIPSSNNIDSIDYSIMGEVVNFILNYESPYKYRKELIVNPDFNEKIKFNNLGDEVNKLLTTSNWQTHILDDYFKLNSDFTKNELRNKFNEIYIEATIKIQDQEKKSDLIFFYILEKASPQNKKAVIDTVLVLMSYYFEYCDIFEPVIKEENN